MSVIRNIYLLIATTVIFFFTGFVAGYVFNEKPPATAPTIVNIQDLQPRPEIKQKDGSIVLEKQPTISPKPRVMVREGYKVERVISTEIKPKQPDCKPVSVDIALVEKDGEKRVVVGSENGEVVGGIDMPTINLSPAKEAKKWAAGISYNSDSKYGVWVDKDIGPVRLGIEAVKTNDNDMLYMAKIGIKF